jgi:hypothetical protein
MYQPNGMVEVMDELVSFQREIPVHEQVERIIGHGGAFVCALK